MHSLRILHRDLKPANILINSTLNIKIADFGLARLVNIPTQVLTKEVETLFYRGPELLLGNKNYNFGLDIWSVGCIFAELINKKPLFPGCSDIDCIFKIFNLLGTPNDDYMKALTDYPYFKLDFPKFKRIPAEILFPNFKKDEINFLYKLLVLDQAQRISAAQALNDEYFDDLDKRGLIKK